SLGKATTLPTGLPPRRTKPAPTPLPDLRNVWTTVRGTNVRVSSQAAPGDTMCPPPGTTLATFQNASRLMFSRTQSDQIRDLLRFKRITLNDWAIAITLHTLANVTASAASQRAHVMIMNPVEM